MSAAIVLHGNFQLSVIFNYLKASTSSGVNGIFLPKRRAPVSVIR